MLILFVSMALVLSPLISVLTKKQDIRNRKKYAKELFDAIKENDLQPNKSDIEISNFVADMLFKRQSNLWNRKTFIGKWCLGMIAPERSDHFVDVP
ncbi:hypothetical protein [Parashewanella curva]|nr:hypothetical protein [Parashewanella curva]